MLIPAGKFLASIFWDKYGILLIDYLPKGQTINTEYYLFLLVQLNDILKGKLMVFEINEIRYCLRVVYR
jgi:hypothetical protein